MINRISFYLLIFVFIYILGCTQKINTSNRSYFAFDQEDRKIILPVELNDSVKVKLTFDTGDEAGFFYERVLLDSTIFALHLKSFSDSTFLVSQTGSAWGWEFDKISMYNSDLNLMIGNVNFTYTNMYVMNWKRHMNSCLADGLFNIPKSDTTHIWELNFENNYVEVHSADSYNIPEKCFMTPLVGPDNFPFFIDLPLKLRFADHDTMTIHQRFLIDTGAAWDVVLLCDSQELDFLNKREDAVWIKFLHSYMRYYMADATLFDGVSMDSLRIYTIDYKNNIASTNYIIGLNFLKRFNVFFDMKNKQLGLQPIKNFQRLVNPLYERFHYSTHKTQDGRFIINQMGRYKENYYRTAGLRMRDEIVAIDKIPYKEITREVESELKKRDSLTFDIVRRGKPLSVVVKIDPNEPKGD